MVFCKTFYNQEMALIYPPNRKIKNAKFSTWWRFPPNAPGIPGENPDRSLILGLASPKQVCWSTLLWLLVTPMKLLPKPKQCGLRSSLDWVGHSRGWCRLTLRPTLHNGLSVGLGFVLLVQSTIQTWLCIPRDMLTKETRADRQPQCCL